MRTLNVIDHSVDMIGMTANRLFLNALISEKNKNVDGSRGGASLVKESRLLIKVRYFSQVFVIKP